MSDAYIVEIEEPGQIPPTVYETVKRCQENRDGLVLLLDHQERENVVRGYAEPLKYNNSDQSIEDTVRRPDGGLSWYHNNTICYMRAEHTGTVPPEEIGEKRQEWLEEITDILLETVDDSSTIEDDGPDLYLTDGTTCRQVVGSSSRHTRNVDLHRSCWYEDDPQSNEMDRLLERDGIDPDLFYESILPVGAGPRETVEDQHSFERIKASAFITEESLEQAREDQQRNDGTMQGSCVLSPYPAPIQ
jgi:hypothetical protein